MVFGGIYKPQRTEKGGQGRERETAGRWWLFIRPKTKTARRYWRMNAKTAHIRRVLMNTPRPCVNCDIIVDMATLSLFYGILITMRPEMSERHKGAHIHARHAGRSASFSIETGEILAGEMDRDDVCKVQAWISIHREDLFANWELLQAEGKFFKIEPLR